MKRFFSYRYKQLLLLLLVGVFFVGFFAACSNPNSGGGELKGIKTDAAQKNEAGDASESGSAAQTATSLLEQLVIIDKNKEAISHEQYKDKYVFTTFFTTTCTYCIHELPALNKVYNDYKDDERVEFLLINVLTGGETIDNTIDFMRNLNNYDIPFVFMTQEEAFNLGVNGFPLNFILGPDGQPADVKVRDSLSVKIFYGVNEEQIRDYLKQVLES